MRQAPILLILLVLWVLILPVTSVAAACRFAYAAFTNPRASWNMAIAYDQFLNATANGDPDETLSSRAGKAQDQGKLWACILCRWFLDRIEKDHCKNARGI